MLNSEKLKHLVIPYQANRELPYFRPFVRKGETKQFDVFLIGINPATPIYPHDIDLDAYVALLENEKLFYSFYEEIRRKQGKPNTSRTRTGIKHFVKKLVSSTGCTVLETNAVAYPTASVKDLKSVPSETLSYARNIFFEVLLCYKPNVLIVHSKRGLQMLLQTLYEQDMIVSDKTPGKTIKILEADPEPVVTFSYTEQAEGAIFVCRHLMYHGKEGKSFTAFREKIIRYITNRSFN